MGRYKKGQRLKRADVWAEAGGEKAIVYELVKADILNRDQSYSSDVWTDVAIALFGEDTQRNRIWLWVIWTQNRKGIRDQLAISNPCVQTSGTSRLEQGDVMTNKDTEADIVQNNLDPEEDRLDLEKESATEASGINNNGQEDTKGDQKEDTETGPKLVDLLWNKPSTELVVAILRSPDHKQEYLLHHSAFQTLRPHECLVGETIECYIRAILNAKASAKLYQLSHYTSGVIFNGTREQLAQQGLRNVDFQQYDGVITAVNVTNTHWRFVYAHARSKQIFVLDPQCGNDEMEAATQACQKFGEFFEMRRNGHGKADWVDTKWEPGTINHTFQNDGFNCGVFVMRMARQVVEDFPKIPESIDIDPSKDWMWQCRRNLAKEILVASVSREEYCSVCGLKHTHQTQKLCIWIRCESCQRWFHGNCLNIVLPSKYQPWFCVLCI